MLPMPDHLAALPWYARHQAWCPVTHPDPPVWDDAHEAAEADADERDRLAADALAEASTVPGRWEVSEVALPTRHESARVWLVWHYAEDLDGIVVLHRDGMWRAVDRVHDHLTVREAMLDAVALVPADDAREALTVLEAP